MLLTLGSRVCWVGQGKQCGDEDVPAPSPVPSDCPQVQCVHPYVAQQPDELTLELADILNILDKTEDGEAWGWVPLLLVAPRSSASPEG